MKAEADNSNFNFSQLCDDVSFAGGARERHSPGPNLALNGPEYAYFVPEHCDVSPLDLETVSPVTTSC